MKFLIFFTFVIGSTSNAQIIIPFGFWSCKLPPSIASDTLITDFALGTMTNTMPSGATIILMPAQTTGTFTSRIFNLLGSCIPNSNWLSVSWNGSLPYGKLLPDFQVTAQNEIITDYSNLSSNTFMNGVMGSWHMQETATGTASGGKDFSDSSGNSIHGTIFGGVTLNSTGKIGRAILFNGSSGYINFGTPAGITGLSNWSVSFWIYPVALTANQQIILYRSDNDAQQGFFITMTSTGQIRLQTVCATTDAQTVSTNTLSAGTWSHVVITTDSSVTSANSKIYINGAQVTYTGAINGSGAHTTAAAQTLFIGKTGSTSAPSTNAFLNARLQEVTFFNRQLNSTEITELYRRGINRVKMQFRSCILSNCADLPSWRGPDGTSAAFFTELNNNSNQSTWLGAVLAPFPNMIFSALSID